MSRGGSFLVSDSEIRLWIYEHFVDTGGAPSPIEIAAHFQLAPPDVEQRLRRLQEEAEALVLLPGSSYIWMAENALAIPALIGTDGSVSTACPHSGQPLLLSVTSGRLADAQGVVHFAVPARDWWRDIGFT